ncbi:MAG: hypothetical protein KJZ93_21135 [Caldilineaceae bacterium]|nr:hypothetical protein [Caldilineaceae bacterium]
MSATANPPTSWSNDAIAQLLDNIADLLEAQEANPYRVRAYRQAATTLRELKQPAQEILAKDGVEGLRRLPTIGVSLARAIEQLTQTGKINLLEQLRGETAPERILATITGIGPVLAARIHEQLGIETLAELEAAAYDGRLREVPGFGVGRLRGVRETLAGRLHRRPRPTDRGRPQPPADAPPVSELLGVDREYREKAAAKRLPTIAPRRFNPTGQAWLPILHTDRGNTHYTALFSNTARAHELGATNDWVVIYRDDQDGAGQWTVVTARFGALQGKRIVRGREQECADHYANIGA